MGRGGVNMINKCMKLSNQSINQSGSGWPPNSHYKVFCFPQRGRNVIFQRETSLTQKCKSSNGGPRQQLLGVKQSPGDTNAPARRPARIALSCQMLWPDSMWDIVPSQWRIPLQSLDSVGRTFMAYFTLHRLGEVVEQRLFPVLQYCRCRVGNEHVGQTGDLFS